MSHIESNAGKKVPYPKRVAFIIGNEFCERFSYTGMITILSLYLKNKLNYTEDDATVIYHASVMGSYIASAFGGIVSDVWFGKFKTIFVFAVVYAIGSTVTAVSSIPNINISANVLLMIGLVLIAIGSGGIKPCVSTFAGDQFKLPEQVAQLNTFFSYLVFSLTLGSFISAMCTPILREDVQCFGSDDCYPLAFGLPAILMVVALVLFLVGKRWYTYVKLPKENMLVETCKCIMNAILTKSRDGKTNPRKNLLDYSIDKYGEEIVNEVRTVMRILLLYLPFPLFWALYEQRGSRWTFQANKMNGDIGFYIIKPDQFQMLNPICVLLFIPLFETVFYPFLRMIGIRRPIFRMVIATGLALISFICAAVIQYRIDSNDPRTVSMLWLFPQYILMSAAEAIFTPTGIAFSYEQAPKRMKSIVMTFWLLAVAVGSLLLIIITKLALFDSQVYEFLFYAGLMLVDSLLLAVLAYNYKHNDVKPESDGTEPTKQFSQSYGSIKKIDTENEPSFVNSLP